MPHKKNKNCIEKYDLRRANFRNFRESLRTIPVPVGSTVDQSWNELKKVFMEIHDICIPKIRISTSGKQNPSWYNEEIGREVNERKRLYSLSREQQTEEILTTYKQQCRKVKRVVRKAKRDEEIRVARNSKQNPKEFYKHVNSRKPIKNSIGPLKNETEELISSEVGMADLLNKYFTSVFTKEREGTLPEPALKYDGDRPLENIDITIDKVQKKIKQMNKNKSPGPDGFLPRVIKEVEEEIAPHFHRIFRESLAQGQAVLDWKLANVTPIFKKGAKDNPSNYRPISLTSVVGKMLESIIADEIVEFLETNNLLLNSQHGFRHKRSCVTNLLEFFHKMFGIYDESKAIDILYLDFQKAFDKVPHRRLMSKVRALGIRGKVADWIENWLSNRKQRVVINGKASEWVDVTSGVPQGSVLGPLLFMIYINDLPEGIKSFMSMFADDTKVLKRIEDEESCRELQNDLDMLQQWSEN